MKDWLGNYYEILEQDESYIVGKDKHGGRIKIARHLFKERFFVCSNARL